MQSRFNQFKNADKAVRWMNQSYRAMEELTGGLPYDGNRVIFKESVEHSYWAYAGQEIILNTNFVESTLKDFDNGLLSFGWVHEMGHDFDDGIGEWYIWSGPAAEFQANFKLCYVIETIEDQSFKMSQTVKVPNFPLVEKSKKVSGIQMSHKSFLFFGDKYLSESKRSWESLSSDEMHSLFQRIQITYGWDAYKNWYRTYRELKEEGFSPPESKEDKINLIAAILSNVCSVDLIPLFKTWRLPVSKEKVELIEEKYKLNKGKEY